MRNGYEILHYRPEWMTQTVRLLQYLWGADFDTSRAYFKWKYIDNPYTEFPLGVAARHDGNIVGFKGYFVNRHEIPGKCANIGLLIPGDVCVHPAHRLKGISVKLTEFALDCFQDKYRLLLSMTSNRKSMPGTIKSDFVPLTNKVYLSRYQPGGLLNYILDYNPAAARAGKYVSFGKFGHMKVSGRPEPKSMAAVIENQPGGDGRIRLAQDEVFFRWRFNNIRGRYIFYYLEPAGVLEAYVVIRLSPNGRRGYIIDFAGRAPVAIAGVLRFIVETKPVDILSIYHFSPDNALLKALFRLGFKRNSFLRMIEKRQTGELPLMIRPLAKDYTVRDFYIHGLDTRRIENWQIKEIFSDGV